MVVPQDIVELASVLPPRSDRLDGELQVLFVGPGHPVPTHVGLRWVLGVRQEKVLAALAWLKLHHPDYRELTISTENLATYSPVAADGHPVIPAPVFANIHIDREKKTAKDGSSYVAANEPGAVLAGTNPMTMTMKTMTS
jgi:hypothetical protein